MAGIVSLLTKVFTPAVTNTSLTTRVSTSSNPFSNNPFVSFEGSGYSTANYAKNNPVKGGYFAGYYNDKPNIVGRKLFIEV